MINLERKLVVLALSKNRNLRRNNLDISRRNLAVLGASLSYYSDYLYS